MAQTNQAKKMEFKPVEFDITEITPDAPAGEWEMVIPRGKCKVQPTKEEKLPMVVVPVRLESTEEDEEKFQKALGTELTLFLVFGGKNARAERMSKLRIRQLCEILDVDLDDIPKKITDPENDLEKFIKAIEGKKFRAWTKLQIRKDTGEETTELVLVDPNRLTGGGNDDDDDDDEDDDKASKSKAKAPAKKTNGKRR